MKFTKGHLPWNKGAVGIMKAWNKGLKGIQIGWCKGKTKDTNSTVKRIAEAKMGRSRPDMLGNKFRMGIRPKSWKGGVMSKGRMERIKFRKTIHGQVLERDNYTCQICGERGTDLQVDHIQSWSNYMDLRFDSNNCRTLCTKCHYFITFGKTMPEGTRAWGHNLKFVLGGGG